MSIKFINSNKIKNHKVYYDKKLHLPCLDINFNDEYKLHLTFKTEEKLNLCLDYVMKNSKTGLLDISNHIEKFN